MSKLLADVRMQLWVQDGQFLVGQAPSGGEPAVAFELPEDFPPTNGLLSLSPSTGALWIFTGINTGWVALTMGLFDGPVDMARNEMGDLVELSITMTQPDLVPIADEIKPDHPSNRLALGPGSYRLRCYASDRDYARDGVDPDEYHEFYVIQVWPAPPDDHVVVDMISREGIESAAFAQ